MKIIKIQLEKEHRSQILKLEGVEWIKQLITLRQLTN